MNKKSYHINVNGTLVKVTEEQYLCYYRAKRRMRYFEHDIKTETPIRNKAGSIIGFAPSKEDSLDRILGTGVEFIDLRKSVEDIVIRKLMSEKLHEALDKLPNRERELIDALFFSNYGDGMSMREYSSKTGFHFMTIHSRKVRILHNLRIFLMK